MGMVMSGDGGWSLGRPAGDKNRRENKRERNLQLQDKRGLTSVLWLLTVGT